MAAQCCNGPLRRGHRSRGFRPCLVRMAVSARARPRFNAGRPLFGIGFQRWSLYGSRSNRALASPAFGGCSFLRDSRAERHSAVQRSPRSHSSASSRSRSAVALSSWARASLRYRIARALLMATQTPRNRKRVQVQEKDLVPGSAGEPCRAAPICFERSAGPQARPAPATLSGLAIGLASV
jgi:hypothetical protein